MKKTLVFFLISLVVPVLFLIVIAFTPYPASGAIADFAAYPVTHSISKEILDDLTLSLYGRQKANSAGVVIFLSILFWFVVTFLFLIIFNRIRLSKSNQ